MDKELASASVLTSEGLRAAALSASAQRGVQVARRRIVLRWTAWLAWRWLLPVIGLATVLAVLLVFASIQFLGPAKVFDTSQTWLAEQLGQPKTKTAPISFDLDRDRDYSSATSPNLTTPPTVIPQLQIDRNYSRHDQSNAVTSAAPTVQNPISPTKPPGAQP